MTIIFSRSKMETKKDYWVSTKEDIRVLAKQPIKYIYIYKNNKFVVIGSFLYFVFLLF